MQHVAVEADRLQMQVAAAERRGLNQGQSSIADGVSKLLGNARAAALGDDPRPHRFPNWWRGTLVEAAYLNLHTARAQIVDLYDENELRAEIPTALARAQATMHRDDPRRTAAEQVLQAEDLNAGRARPLLRRLIGDSYEMADREHTQLRSFRNILLLSAVSMFVLVAITVFVVWRNPEWMPLCFPLDGGGTACPTSTGSTGPSSADILMVALLGALGGALTASLSIRNLKGTSTPYDVPVALAMLKVPLLATHPERVDSIGAGDPPPDVPADLRPLFTNEEVAAVVRGEADDVHASLNADTLQTIMRHDPAVRPGTTERAGQR